jgi:hypothetical protein
MRLHTLAILPLLAVGSALLADPIPYPTPGTPVSGSTTVTANGGDITGYFVSYNAGDTDVLYLVDLATNTRVGPTFQNNATAQGSTFDFGTYAAGTPLAFEIVNESTGATYSSDTALSDDGENHAYTTSFAGGTLADGNGVMGTYVFPAGTYVGFEDLPFPSPANNSEPDYNDLAFVFNDVTAVPPPAVTPEPSTFVLLGTGLIGAAGALRRRFAL